MAIYRIKDVEVLTGIKAHTLRIWEQRYGMLIPERTETKIRTYSDEELVYLLNVRILLDYGMKISRIAELNKDEIKEKVKAFTLKTPVDGAQEKLIVALIEMDEALFNETINQQIETNSVDALFKSCLVPFFERIGVMWLTGSINPAQEHFISSLIRQKVIAEIDKLPIPKKTERSGLLYLPEHEWHEIGLLLYQYILRKEGIYTLYLGQSVPYDALIESINKVQPAFVITSWLTSVEENFIQSYFSQLRRQYPSLPIIVGGAQLGIHYSAVNQLVHVVQNSTEILHHLKSPSLQSFREQ